MPYQITLAHKCVGIPFFPEKDEPNWDATDLPVFEPGQTFTYTGHLPGGMIRVETEDGTKTKYIIHPAATKELA